MRRTAPQLGVWFGRRQNAPISRDRQFNENGFLEQSTPREERFLGRAMSSVYGRGAQPATTKWAQADAEGHFTDDAGQPPLPADHSFSGSTERHPGALSKFPVRRYPNPKTHHSIIANGQGSLQELRRGPNSLLARVYHPFERKNKKIMMKKEYLPHSPDRDKSTKEYYKRLKYGLFDLDRTMPELWGPQEGFKLDRDEWLFKLLYFVHPIKEGDLCMKVEEFPHNPFDNDKDVVMGLERLVSREYVRRVKGSKLEHPLAEADQYYWTLMPDELEFGERIVEEEKYLRQINEEEPVTAPLYPLREEMCELQYQEKHNTYRYFDEIRDAGALRRFIAFCDTEAAEVERKLEAIGKDVEFEDDEKELAKRRRTQSYPHPPCFLSQRPKKRLWHAVGHWRESIPDGAHKLEESATGHE